MKSLRIIICACLVLFSVISCSTTRVLEDGEYRLSKAEIEITNDKKFNAGTLTPYLKQKHNPWTPFLYVYNWSDGTDSFWDRVVKRIGVAPVVYDAAMVESSIENMHNHLERLGYYGSVIDSDVSLKKRNVNVLYRITLGKRYPIKDIEVVLPERGEFAEAFISDSAKTSLHVGDILSEVALEKESERSSLAMRNMGFYDFNKNYYFFEADTLSFPGSALLQMKINEYTRNESEKQAEPIRKFYFNNVSIEYPKTMKFRESVLKGMNTIIPGEVYSESAVNNTYSRLSALRIFSSVNIGMTKVDTNLVDCSITLTQSKMQGFKVNLEASSNSSGLFGVSPQISYYHKNIFNGGEWLNLSFMGNFQFKFNDNVRSNEFGVSAGLSFPRFLLLPYRIFKGAIPRTDINVSYNYQNRPEYTRNIISTSYGYNGNVRNSFFYQIYPVQLNIVNIFDLDRNFYENLSDDPFLRNAYQNHFDLGMGGTLYYTTNPESIPKSSAFYTRFQVDVAGNLLSAFKQFMDKDSNGSGIIWNTPYSQFVRGEITIGKTWVFGQNASHSLATRFVAGAGYAYGNSSALPFEKHFYGGGANSLRGWQARTVGPGLAPMDKSFVIPNQTGDMRLEANVEYRFNLFWKLAGALFVDAGNVWTLQDDGGTDSMLSRFRADKFAESIAANWGLGIRLDLDFLLLRVDMGVKMHDPAREQKWVRPAEWFARDGYALHFGVGYPF